MRSEHIVRSARALALACLLVAIGFTLESAPSLAAQQL